MDSHKWSLRSIGQEMPQYWDSDPLKALFTVKMCYWGEFKDNGYVGGVHEYIDFCRIDLITMSDLVDMAAEMGFYGALTFHHWCEERGLRKIITDDDIKNIGPYLPIHRQVTIILVHIKPLSVSPQLPTWSRVEVNLDGDYDGQPEPSDIQHSTFAETFNDSAYEDDDQIFEENVEEESEVNGQQSKKAIEPKSNKNEPKHQVRMNEDLEADVMSDKMPRLRVGGDDAPVWPEFSPKTNINDPIFKMGMLFSNNKVFKEAVLNYAVKTGRGSIYLAKNESLRVRFKCAEGCPWKITARKMQNDNTLQVKRFTDIHTCVREPINKHVKSGWLATRFLQEFKRQPDMPCKTFVDLVWNTLVLKISGSQALRARQKAVQMIQGSLLEQYPKLWNYVLELKAKNPGTTAEIVTEPGSLASGAPVFKRIYICLGGLKEGFKHCRPIIGVDGTHLKSANGGVLLTAVGIDSNNNMYPLAYAVVESETKDSWTWFLELLRNDVEIVNETGWTFISDKQKGLLAAFEDVIPNAEFRFCFQHMHLNFSNAGHRGMQLRELLWNCARATNIRRFKQHMQILKDTDQEAANWLNDKPPNQWSKSHFSPYPKCDLVCNNLCESFNGLISKAREMPILSMLEDVREFLMTRIVRNRTLRKKWWGSLCPNALERLEKGKEKAGECIVYASTDTEFQVKTMLGDQYTVDLGAWGCSCRRWDITGIPCHHAIACIFFMYQNPEAFVNDLYKIETYDKIYVQSIAPMTNSDCWDHIPNTVLFPPHYHKLPGRPKKCRRKNKDEPKPVPDGCLGKRHQVSLRCSKCKQVGHNARKHKFDNVVHGEAQPQPEVQAGTKVVSQDTDLAPPFVSQSSQSQPEVQAGTEVVSQDTDSAPPFVSQSSQSQPFVTPSSQCQPLQKRQKLNVHRKTASASVVRRSSTAGFQPSRQSSYEVHSNLADLNVHTSSSSPNPRGWLATGTPQTTTSFNGTPLIMKGGKKFVTLNNLSKAMKAAKNVNVDAATGKQKEKKK